ncbi:MAG: YvcK family protein, partial [Candidatus Omnitrophica bacterium]|nr:YvcK family protein [Candidatus Omnitrophota bacterium]
KLMNRLAAEHSLLPSFTIERVTGEVVEKISDELLFAIGLPDAFQVKLDGERVFNAEYVNKQIREIHDVYLSVRTGVSLKPQIDVLPISDEKKKTLLSHARRMIQNIYDPQDFTDQIKIWMSSWGPEILMLYLRRVYLESRSREMLALMNSSEEAERQKMMEEFQIVKRKTDILDAEIYGMTGYQNHRVTEFDRAVIEPFDYPWQDEMRIYSMLGEIMQDAVERIETHNPDDVESQQEDYGYIREMVLALFLNVDGQNMERKKIAEMLEKSLGEKNVEIYREFEIDNDLIGQWEVQDQKDINQTQQKVFNELTHDHFIIRIRTNRYADVDELAERFLSVVKDTEVRQNIGYKVIARHLIKGEKDSLFRLVKPEAYSASHELGHLLNAIKHKVSMAWESIFTWNVVENKDPNKIIHGKKNVIPAQSMDLVMIRVAQNRDEIESDPFFQNTKIILEMQASQEDPALSFWDTQPGYPERGMIIDTESVEMLDVYKKGHGLSLSEKIKILSRPSIGLNPRMYAFRAVPLNQNRPWKTHLIQIYVKGNAAEVDATKTLLREAGVELKNIMISKYTPQTEVTNERLFFVGINARDLLNANIQLREILVNDVILSPGERTALEAIAKNLMKDMFPQANDRQLEKIREKMTAQDLMDVHFSAGDLLNRLFTNEDQNKFIRKYYRKFNIFAFARLHPSLRAYIHRNSFWHDLPLDIWDEIRFAVIKIMRENTHEIPLRIEIALKQILRARSEFDWNNPIEERPDTKAAIEHLLGAVDRDETLKTGNLQFKNLKSLSVNDFMQAMINSINALKDQGVYPSIDGRPLVELAPDPQKLQEHINRYCVVKSLRQLNDLLDKKNRGVLTAQEQLLYDGLFNQEGYLKKYTESRPLRLVVFRGGRGASEFTKKLKELKNVLITLVVSGTDDSRSHFIPARLFHAPGVPDLRKSFADLMDEGPAKEFFTYRLRGEHQQLLRTLLKLTDSEQKEDGIDVEMFSNLNQLLNKMDQRTAQDFIKYINLFLKRYSNDPGVTRHTLYDQFSFNTMVLGSIVIIG